LQRFPTFTADLQKSLFRERHDLVPIARNPFLAALLGEWVHQNRTLPQNQAQLYESYLAGRLAKCASKLTHFGLTADDVLRAATDIGWFVFESPEYGLEAPVPVIANAGITDHALAVIDVLSYARIARVTPGDNKSFAFVHRRFLEYFVTMRLLAQPDALPVGHIPTDSRGRDVMVLYAQLCEPAAAEKLAVLCWEEIQKHFDDPLTRLRGIHSLRFLIDAYRSRRSALACFAAAFSDFIHQKVEKGENLLDAKICLEGTGLLAEEAALPVLMLALQGNNSWLQETAFRACRSLPKLSVELERAIIHYIVRMPILQFHERRRSIIFSLALSDVLAGARWSARIKSYNFAAALFCFFAFLGLNFIFTFGVAAIVAFIQFMVLAIADSPVLGKKRTAAKMKNSNTSFDIFREIFCLIVIYFSLLGFLGEDEPFLRFLNDGAVLALNNGIFGQFSIFMMLGLIIQDWLIAWLWLGSALTSLRTKLAQNIVPVLLGMIFFILIPYVIKFLGQYDVAMKAFLFLYYGVVLVVIFCVLILISGSCLQVFHYLQDWRYFKTIAISAKISREEIVSIMAKFNLPHWRIKFIHKLAQHKTMATGNWPDNFKLAVTDDPVLTELAKLEERWLKLDR
jgi:hypothetical protein